MDTLNQEIVMNIPFTKVNKQKRTVTGIATADNVDLEGDVVEFAASLDAFNNWVGNIREMHAPIAVGKAVDFRPTTVPGPDGQLYRGIEVEAYISKGAESTWEKVLDKTLSGFSIGGRVVKAEHEFDKSTGKKIKKILELILVELSLVDNPANPLAMLSMVKSTKSGELEIQPGFEGESHQIYYCIKDEVAKSDNPICSYCEKEMELLGFADRFEVDNINKMINTYLEKNGGDYNLTNDKSNDTIVDVDTEITDSQKESLVKRLGDVLFGKNDDQGGELIKAASGTQPATVSLNFNGYTTTGTSDGLYISPSTTTSAPIINAEPVAKSVDADDAGGGEVDDESLEKAASDETVEESNDKEDDTEMDMEKFMDGISTLLDDKMSAFKQEISEQVNTQIEEVQKSVTDVTEKIETQDASIQEVTGKVEDVAKSGAIKKSNDDVDEDEVDEELEKSLEAEPESFWGGIFVPREISKALGYDS